MRHRWLAVAAAAALAAPPALADEPTGPRLAKPVQIQAGGKPISVEVGHAAPCVADIHGDGKPVLLVGQFGGGKLRVYPNKGTRAEPRFDAFTYLQAGGKEASVPSG
jgi:hypothetical protein